jgi:hypothetical protein
VIIEELTLDGKKVLVRHEGARLRRRHGQRNEPLITLANGDRDYFNLLEYNPEDSSNQGRPTLHVCHTVETLPIQVDVANYAFTLKARSDESISEPIFLRFEQLFNNDSRLIQIVAGGQLDDVPDFVLPDPSKPHLSISNGSALAFFGYGITVDGIVVENDARDQRTVAAQVESTVLYEHNITRIPKDNLAWAVCAPSHSSVAGSFEITYRPDIDSMDPRTYSLPLAYRTETGFYIPDGKPGDGHPILLAEGLWNITVLLKSKEGCWTTKLALRLRPGQQMQWAKLSSS